MTIYSIDNFDDGPHWSAAFIEAGSEAAARQIMRGRLDGDLDTIHEALPEDQWKVRALTSPLQFVLGSWCR